MKKEHDIRINRTKLHNNGLKILEGSLANDSYGMVVKKGNSELLNIINKVLNRLKEEGKIEEFVIKHTS